MDPSTPCHILCPPVSETHRGGSTDAQGARREGNKGMESTRIPGEDQLHLSGAGGKARCCVLPSVAEPPILMMDTKYLM